MDEQRVTRRQQVAGHGLPHDAEADETDVAHWLAPRAMGRRHRTPSLPIGQHPVEPGLGRAARLVLAADPARVAELVEAAEQERVVDLARPGLVAPRVVGDLDVADAGQQALDGRASGRPP